MSALLDNIRDGNRNDCRDILASVDLIEDLMDSGSSALNAIDNVRRLVERL
jgi:hypothetical protein